MCGIAAVFSYGPNALPVDAPLLTRVRDSMSHRGPDAAGLWISGDRRIGLAHRRLSIIDVTRAGDQPMELTSAGVRIVFNGEIYNHADLRRSLELRGHVFRTRSDTEVLLNLYQEYGTRMVEHLRGMYAFAIWDARQAGLFLARDPFGIKPLYYTDDGARIYVASEVKALARAGQGSERPCPTGQVGFLLWGFVLEPYTLFKDIQSLPAGSTMWIDAKGPRQPARFWSEAEVMRAAQDLSPGMDLRGAFAVPVREMLRESLVDSLRHHFVSDVPVGVFLSGGLDSSSLLALAAEEKLSDLHTLTLGFDQLKGTPADEVSYAEGLARVYQTDHRSDWIGAERFAEDMDAILTAMDQPSIDGINSYLISAMTARAGLKVALSGLGGDELFAGYPSFSQIPRLVNALTGLPGISNVGRMFRHVSAPLLKHLTSPKFAGLLEYGSNVEDAYLLRRGLFMPWELPEIIDPETAREGWQALAVQARLKTHTAGLRDMRAQISCLELGIYMRNQLLRDSDWASMAHSIEIRVPFVDHVLFTALAPFLTGPSQLRKTDVANTLRRPLPPAILARPKTGFTVPVHSWLAKSNKTNLGARNRGLRSWAKQVLKHQLLDRRQRSLDRLG